MKTGPRIRILLATALGLGFAAALGAQVRVVTSSPTLADLVKQVGGQHVQVESIMRGPENPHNVIAKPSFMMKLRRADLFVHTGLDGEPWVPLLVKGTRRSHLLAGGDGNIDASRGVAIKDVPDRGGLSRALGDIHAQGNPHYLLDPANAPVVARTIAAALIRADPDHRDDYEKNLASFEARVEVLGRRLDERMRPYAGTRVATYHRAWRYLLDRFGLVKVAEVEPKPGISPWPAHLEACIARMKAENAKVVLVETYSHYKSAAFVAEKAGGIAVVLGQEVDSLEGTDTYEKLLERNVQILLDAFEKAGVEPVDGDSPDKERR